LPIKEDREDASETRAGERPAEDERTGGFSTRLFAARWSVAAGLCLLVAAVLLLLWRVDAAFVVATIGAVAWFWNERNRLRPAGIEADEKFRDEEEEFEDRDEE
jgi:hypothetical protein